jgi:hypothetical protein
MASFAVTLMHGAGWDTGRPIRSQAGWNEHAAFMDGLVEDGFLVVGGPAADRLDRVLGALARQPPR